MPSYRIYLMGRGKEDNGIFESLQEEKTVDEYGNIIGKLVCMYKRMLDQEDQFGVVDHDLTTSQRQKIQDLKEALVEGNAYDDEMDYRFHKVVQWLFFWNESHQLLEVLDCLVQHLLVYASVEMSAKRSISVGQNCLTICLASRGFIWHPGSHYCQVDL